MAITHTDVAADIRGLAGFVPVAKYGSRKPISEFEIGSVEDVRRAIAREKQLKGWNRRKKIKLIESVNPRWGDLDREVGRADADDRGKMR